MSRTYFLYDGTLPVIEMNSSSSVIATNSFRSSRLASRNQKRKRVLHIDTEGNVSDSGSVAISRVSA
jgi:hypothetical protein